VKLILQLLALTLIATFALSESAPEVRVQPPPAPKLFSERVEIEGAVVAYQWTSHMIMGFEGIYVDVMVVRVDKVVKGDKLPKYIRVDFWGNVDPKLKLQLPEELFKGSARWKMLVNRPSAVFPRNSEVCQPLSKDTITLVHEDTGKSEEVSAFRKTAVGLEDYPDVRHLPCFVVKETQVNPLSSRLPSN
jgi:hypothetical protein